MAALTDYLFSFRFSLSFRFFFYNRFRFRCRLYRLWRIANGKRNTESLIRLLCHKLVIRFKISNAAILQLSRFVCSDLLFNASLQFNIRHDESPKYLTPVPWLGVMRPTGMFPLAPTYKTQCVAHLTFVVQTDLHLAIGQDGNILICRSV